MSTDAIVSCDPQMCAVLEAHRVPAARLLPLGGSNPDPLGSDLIVSTAAVRSEFGARLASVYAPVELASFGTGSAQTAVRVVASDGGAAYLRGLRTDVAARAAAGRQLLQNPRLHSSARGAPRAGRRPGRLAAADRVRRAGHHVPGPGGRFPRARPRGERGHAAPGRGHRPAGPGTRQRPDTMASLARYLRNQLTPYQPEHITVVRLANGLPVLRVEYGAPSPLGLLGKG